jgi:hypothetical protein
MSMQTVGSDVKETSFFLLEHRTNIFPLMYTFLQDGSFFFCTVRVSRLFLGII